MVTLMKNYSDEARTQKRIIVKKIVSLKEIIESDFDEIKFKIKDFNELSKINSLSKKNGKTKVYFEIEDNKNYYIFSLKDKRYIDNTLINKLKIRENIIID